MFYHISGANLVFAMVSSLLLYTKAQVRLELEEATLCVIIHLRLFVFYTIMTRKTKSMSKVKKNKKYE